MALIPGQGPLLGGTVLLFLVLVSAVCTGQPPDLAHGVEPRRDCDLLAAGGRAAVPGEGLQKRCCLQPPGRDEGRLLHRARPPPGRGCRAAGPAQMTGAAWRGQRPRLQASCRCSRARPRIHSAASCCGARSQPVCPPPGSRTRTPGWHSQPVAWLPRCHTPGRSLVRGACAFAPHVYCRVVLVTQYTGSGCRSSARQGGTSPGRGLVSSIEGSRRRDPLL